MNKLLVIIFSFGIFISLFFLLDNLDWTIRISLVLIISTLPLWIFEPIPYSQTALWLLIFFLFFQVVDPAVILSGFSSLALFLIIAGLMIGNAIDATNLGDRLVLWFLGKLSTVKDGILIGVIIIQHVLSVFIPAPSIRTALIIPIVETLFEDLPQKFGPIKKEIMLGVAYAGNISTICFLPSGIINIIAVEFINEYTNYQISYVLWFLLMLPIWLLLSPFVYFVIVRTRESSDYPREFFMKKVKDLKSKLPPFDQNERKAVFILIIVILLWSTQDWHGIHPAFTAILGAILLSSPRIGVIKWNQIIKINMEIFLLVGATFSIGNILNESGTARYLADLMTNTYIVQEINHSWMLIFLLVLFVHVYHTLITNIGTAAVTLIPIILSIAPTTVLDPIYAALLTSITLVFCFVFVIGTLPNILVQNSGLVSQKDFIYPGIILTLISTVITVGVSIFWWPIII